MIKKHNFCSHSCISSLLHSLNLKSWFFLFQGLSLLHDILLQALVNPHDWHFFLGDTVRSEPPPHAPGTGALVFPATRRPDVLVSMCCLWLEDKYLPGEHHHGLSRRMLSTLALGNLVLRHNFPTL